jgi:hypothetical protein
MLWFFLFFMSIWLLILVLSEIFRSQDLSGWAKALWTIFVICLPYLGVFVYLIARGGKMQGRAVRHSQDQYPPVGQYVESAKFRGAADAIAQLVDLRNKGVISEEEFQQAKARALA